MSAVLTIGGTSVTFIEDTLDITYSLDERQRLQCDIIDYTGSLHFVKGEQVVLTDPVLGVMFNGYLNSDQEFDIYPTGGIRHTIDCIDQHYLSDKRTYTHSYDAPQPAGKLVVDQLQNVLEAEGIAKNYAQQADTTVSDFAQGILNGALALANVNDGNLELTKAGSDITILENSTSAFSPGTLTNMTASGNALQPTTTNALKMQSTLSFSYGTEFAQDQQTASGTVSGTGSGTASGTASGNFSTTVNSSGSFSTGVSSSGSYTPSGSVSISGGAPGESAFFSGSGGSVNVSGTASSTVSSSGNAAATVNSSFSAPVSTSFSAPVSATVSKTYQPKTRSKVKIDSKHYDIITVDKDVADNRVDATIWTGSMTIGSNDTLNYDIWIASTSPSQEGGVELHFSDGTTLTQYLGTVGTNNDVGVWDQNFVSVSSIQDLSDYAKDTWYTRQINLSILSGKIITSVSIFNAANIAGTFDIYMKNCYLGSHTGTPFFGTSQTTPSLNPPTLSSIGAYITAATLVTVVPVYDPASSTRVSPAYSIDPVKLVRGSLITWTALNPVTGPSVIVGSPGSAADAGSEAIFVSYDGTTWLPCTNNQPLPGLPSGANVTGLSLYLLETFTGGQDPTAVPSLLTVAVTITSAPQATKTDIVSQFGSTSAWNSGTLLGLAPNSNGDLVLGTTSYSWSNLSNMTFIGGYLVDTDVVVPTQSVSSGAYVVTSIGDSDGDTWSSTRFNFISAVQNFTVQADFTLSGSSPTQNEAGFLYRQTYWGSPNNSFAYYVRVMQNSGGSAGGTSVTLGYGTNNPPSDSNIYTSGPYNVIKQVGVTISNGTTYHIKIVVNQNRHTVYWNNGSTPIIDVLDNTYTGPGNIGLRTYVFAGNTNTMTAKIANFSVTNTFAGIWTSPSISLTTLGTCSNTQISWSEITAVGKLQSTAIVLVSLDGGTTWQQCTNGSVSPNAIIPGLPAGTNVVGKSLKIQIILSATTHLTNPIISGLYLRVLGVYPGSSGSRSTIPLGSDTMIRSNVAGNWGTSFDAQPYTQVGTGTVNLISNEGQISNTTGDVHMLFGTRTWTDEEGTVRFSLSGSSITGGIELRYQDSNNFYRLAVTSTMLSIVQVRGGVLSTLVSTSISLSIGVFYRLRFRVAGNGPVNLYGRVWADGVIEATTWMLTTTA